MRFVKVHDEEKGSGEAAINLDLVREAHYGGGMLRLYFERGSSSQDDVTFTGENAKNSGLPWTDHPVALGASGPEFVGEKLVVIEHEGRRNGRPAPLLK